MSKLFASTAHAASARTGRARANRRNPPAAHFKAGLTTNPKNLRSVRNKAISPFAAPKSRRKRAFSRLKVDGSPFIFYTDAPRTTRDGIFGNWKGNLGMKL